MSLNKLHPLYIFSRAAHGSRGNYIVEDREGSRLTQLRRSRMDETYRMARNVNKSIWLSQGPRHASFESNNR